MTHCKKNFWLESQKRFTSLIYVFCFFLNLKSCCIIVKGIPLVNLYFCDIKPNSGLSLQSEMSFIKFSFCYLVFCYVTPKSKGSNYTVTEKKHWINFYFDVDWQKKQYSAMCLILSSRSCIRFQCDIGTIYLSIIENNDK